MESNERPKTETASPELNSVKVPKQFQPIFLKAQEYVRDYFQDWVHEPEKSTLMISGERYLLVRGSSLSVEFFQQVERLYQDQGKEKARKVARELLFDLSHTIGKEDARNFHRQMGVKDPLERLSAGPIHFAYSGWAFVDIHETSQPTPDGNYFLSYDHPFSFEADAWIKRGIRPDHPVCIMNAGYSSGWCEESFGLTLVATEIECRARGDEHCRFVMAPPERIQEHLQRLGVPEGDSGPLIPEFFRGKRVEEELRKTREELEDRVEERTSDLNKTKDRYETLVNSIDGVVWEADRKTGQFLFASRKAEDLLGYPLREWIDTPGFWEERVHPEDREVAKKFRDGKEGGLIEYRMIARDGSVVWVHDIINVVTREGEADRIQGVMVDITELRKAMGALQHAQKLESLGILSGGIAHDFNNILVGVLGNVSRLLATMDPDSEHRRTLEEIKGAARQATDLTDQLLAFSGSGKFTLEAVDLNRMTTEMTHLMEKVISVTTPVRHELDSGIPLTEGDPTQIKQVIMNLVTNASEAIGEEPGVITVRTGSTTTTAQDRNEFLATDAFEDGKQVYLEVEDNGCGISDEHLSKLFDPFYTTKFTGRGLGLAAVRGIVNSHQGAIRIRTTEGKGTTFRILFPASKKTCTEVPKKILPLRNYHGTGLILVIDDDPTVRRVTRAILKEYGYGVITCSTGASAINVFRKRAEAIDCVILDLTLPEISGQELFRKLKEISPDVRVLLSSGHSSERIDKTFPRGSVEGFLKKPYDIATFLEKLREVLPTD